MNYLNGGYVMIKHNATQKDLAAAYKSNRPVLVYDENQKAHWAQINETVTTETVDDEVVTTYTYSYQLINAIESVVDSAGNLRFVEGKGTAATITGLNATYCRWSLSGTHLMCVLAGTLANGTAITPNPVVCSFKLPDYIYNKIIPTVGSIIEYKTIPAYGNDYSSQNVVFRINKDTNNKLTFVFGNTVTLSADRTFRVQFDLLIDSDYSE